MDHREQYRRALELFLQVYELSPEERAAALDRIDGRDTTIRDEVEALLRSHDRLSWRGGRSQVR